MKFERPVNPSQGDMPVTKQRDISTLDRFAGQPPETWASRMPEDFRPPQPVPTLPTELDQRPITPPPGHISDPSAVPTQGRFPIRPEDPTVNVKVDLPAARS